MRYAIGLLGLGLLSALPAKAQLFQGTPPADWVRVEGSTTVKVPEDEAFSRDELLNIARQEAIESRLGTSVSYGNFMKSYQGELDNYEHFVDMTSQFPQGVWKADCAEPQFTSEDTEILRADRRGKLRKRVPAKAWTCRVEGYAQPLEQIQPRFEFQLMNGDYQVVAEQKVGKQGAELVTGTDSVFHQGNRFIARFRSTRPGHLVMFMDNGEKAQRMLPYYAFDQDDDVQVAGGRWHTFFDMASVPADERDTVDELELMTDQEYDAVRIYFLFSESPFTKDFFFRTTDGEVREQLPEGYGELPFVTSGEFARWLQQNRVRKSDLQISVVDLVIDNTGGGEGGAE